MPKTHTATIYLSKNQFEGVGAPIRFEHVSDKLDNGWPVHIPKDWIPWYRRLIILAVAVGLRRHDMLPQPGYWRIRWQFRKFGYLVYSSLYLGDVE